MLSGSWLEYGAKNSFSFIHSWECAVSRCARETYMLLYLISIVYVNSIAFEVSNMNFREEEWYETVDLRRVAWFYYSE
jgi:hypothetical protein